MKKLVLIILFCYNLNVFSQNIAWQRSIGGTSSDCARNIIQLHDDSYIVSGNTRLPSLYYSMYIVKLDVNGNTIWEKMYGCSNVQYTELTTSYYVQQTTDDNLIVAGGDNNGDMWILKLNSNNGSIIWEKHYPNKYAYCIQLTNDGGYIVAGAIKNGSDNDLLVMKLNNLGNQLWFKIYGGSLFDAAYSIKQTYDNGYIVAGYSLSFRPGNSDGWLLKLNENGDTLWTKIYGYLNDDNLQSVVQTHDSCFVSTGSSSHRINVSKFSKNGALIWDKYLDNTGAASYGRSIQYTRDKGFIVAGYKQFGRYDYILYKLDSNGTTKWQKNFGGSLDDYAYSVIQTRDNGYAIAGESCSFALGYSDMWVLKVDSLGGGVYINTCKTNDNNYINIFPNPTSDLSNIEIPYYSENNLKIDIFDNQGNIISSFMPGNVRSFKVDLSKQSEGIYIVKITSTKFNGIKKIIKY